MTLNPISAHNLASGRHGFFTRLGGKSQGVYEGLNCGLGSDDDKETVLSNRAQVAATFDLDKAALVSLYQIHSAKAVVVSEPFEGTPPECDGLATATPGLVLGVLSADCAPVLFEDRASGVVGACHSGWKGAVGGVIEATVLQMIDLGAKRAQISAAVGPCISQSAYEVGPEFLETFLSQNPANGQYFAGGQGDRAMFDLPRFVLDQLREAGLENVAWTGHCTYSDPKRFYSYRRSCHKKEADYGRLISAITL